MTTSEKCSRCLLTQISHAARLKVILALALAFAALQASAQVFPPYVGVAGSPGNVVTPYYTSATAADYYVSFMDDATLVQFSVTVSYVDTGTSSTSKPYYSVSVSGSGSGSTTYPLTGGFSLNVAGYNIQGLTGGGYQWSPGPWTGSSGLSNILSTTYGNLWIRGARLVMSTATNYEDGTRVETYAGVASSSDAVTITKPVMQINPAYVEGAIDGESFAGCLCTTSFNDAYSWYAFTSANSMSSSLFPVSHVITPRSITNWGLTTLYVDNAGPYNFVEGYDNADGTFTDTFSDGTNSFTLTGTNGSTGTFSGTVCGSFCTYSYGVFSNSMGHTVSDVLE